MADEAEHGTPGGDDREQPRIVGADHESLLARERALVERSAALLPEIEALTARPYAQMSPEDRARMQAVKAELLALQEEYKRRVAYIDQLLATWPPADPP